MKHHGSCHCGKIAFDVEGDVTSLLACNCSICARRGSLLWFVPRPALHLTTDESAIGNYTFGEATIEHRFCPECGIHVFGQGIDPATGEAMVAVNARCLEDVDLAGIEVQHFDGKSL